MDSRVQAVVADLVDQLEHAERLIEEQVQRIEALEAELTVLRGAFMAA